MGELIFAPCVEGELWDIWHYIARDNPDAATRVVDAIGETCHILAQNPRLGVARRFRKSRLRGVRFFPVPEFRDYLVFYRAVSGGIQVLHVFHGARDLERLFAGSE